MRSTKLQPRASILMLSTRPSHKTNMMQGVQTQQEQSQNRVATAFFKLSQRTGGITITTTGDA